MTADEIAIRPYDPDDEGRVWAIHERATKRVDAFANPDGVDGGVATTPEEHARESRRLRREGVFLVGEVEASDADELGSETARTGGESTIVATGALDPDGGPAADAAGTAELTRMRVDPDHWREGYGRAILEALEREARAAGWTTLVLETLARQEAARALYEAAGYEEVDRQVVGEFDVREYRKSLN